MDEPKKEVNKDAHVQELEDRVKALEERLDKLLNGEVELVIRELSVGQKSVLRVQCE